MNVTSSGINCLFEVGVFTLELIFSPDGSGLLNCLEKNTHLVLSVIIIGLLELFNPLGPRPATALSLGHLM